MTHRDFEGFEEYSRRVAAATEAGSPDWARLPQSRDVMLEEGGKLYFTGIPCKNGHVSPRDGNRNCTQCSVANMRAYYERQKNAV